jgi:hypothetical protein
MILADKAKLISDALVTKHKMGAEYGTNPFVDILLQILTGLLPTLLSCFMPKPVTAAELHAMISNPTHFQLVVFRWHLRGQIKDPELLRTLFNPLLVELRLIGQNSSEPECQTIIDEA